MGVCILQCNMRYDSAAVFFSVLFQESSYIPGSPVAKQNNNNLKKIKKIKMLRALTLTAGFPWFPAVPKEYCSHIPN